MRNEGSEPLVVDEIEVTGGPFRVDAASATVAPGATEVLELVFEPTDSQTASGTLELRSDDPDEPIVRLRLVGNRAGLGVGDPSPEVVVNLLSGGEWRLSEQRGQVVVLAYFATF